MFKQVVAVSLSLLSTACMPDVGAEPMPPASLSAATLAPEFKGIEGWINSKPLSMAQLRGKVVLVEFWTQECINCIHVTPHINELHRRYHDQGLVIVGVHTPEYDNEKLPGSVQKAVKRFGIEYPVALDDRYETWTAYNNQFWPAQYLIDAEGRIVYRHFGEGSYDETEARIKQLLATR
jgi:thiol-disulfide isomerase/thioredoxin